MLEKKIPWAMEMWFQHPTGELDYTKYRNKNQVTDSELKSFRMSFM